MLFDKDTILIRNAKNQGKFALSWRQKNAVLAEFVSFGMQKMCLLYKNPPLFTTKVRLVRLRNKANNKQYRWW